MWHVGQSQALIQGPNAALERVLDNVVPDSARGCTQLCIDTVTDVALGCVCHWMTVLGSVLAAV